jgi:serine/threonine-protein kinase
MGDPSKWPNEGDRHGDSESTKRASAPTLRGTGAYDSEAAFAADSTEPAEEPASRELPARYVYQGQVAEGGMGRVLAVHDTVLRRDIVMKTLRPSLGDSPEWESSLIEEAQLTSQLDHPNIVPVHDQSCDAEGRTYYTMKRVCGLTLHELLGDSSNQPGSPKRLAELLEVFIKVCDAVAFAHSRGVIHCDIKPANIMVGEFGQVYLMDWGLALIKESAAVAASRRTDSPLASRRSPGMGTLSYMAPEQAEGVGEATDERSDVFALGAVLYHIVTGRPPYQADNVPRLEALARAGAYTKVQDATRVFVPGVLRQIIERALAREPSKRYQSALELKEHVQGFLHGGFHLPRETFAPGTEIVRQGDPGDSAYLITRGQCDVYKQIGSTRRFVRRLTQGTVFGELAVLTCSTRTATVVAVDEVEVLVLSRAVVEEGLSSNSWEGRLVLALVERFRDVDERLTEFERERELGSQ